MNQTGGFTGQLSPDAVKTGIDAVMYETFTRTMQPNYLSASDGGFFVQDTTDLVAFIWDEDSNVGEFDATAEQEDILGTDTFIGNTKTKFSQKYTKQIPISDEAFRADKVGKRNRVGFNIGDRARQTQDKQAILTTYGDAFTGSFNTTPDGQNFASDTHTTLKGATVDNKETGALTPDNAWTVTVSLANQKGQDGDAGSHVFTKALFPFLLYKTGKEVLNSVLIANSAENNLNIFDTDYGEVQIRASIFLGSSFNAASNANTSYHFMGDNHQVTRKVFYELTSTMISPEYTDNDNYVMRSKFHESTFPGTWTAYVGSVGTTA